MVFHLRHRVMHLYEIPASHHNSSRHQSFSLLHCSTISNDPVSNTSTGTSTDATPILEHPQAQVESQEESTATAMAQQVLDHQPPSPPPIYLVPKFISRFIRLSIIVEFRSVVGHVPINIHSYSVHAFYLVWQNIIVIVLSHCSQ
jgi:hypothetical protein